MFGSNATVLGSAADDGGTGLDSLRLLLLDGAKRDGWKWGSWRAVCQRWSCGYSGGGAGGWSPSGRGGGGGSYSATTATFLGSAAGVGYVTIAFVGP